jgi:hypothetical protein
MHLNECYPNKIPSFMRIGGVFWGVFTNASPNQLLNHMTWADWACVRKHMDYIIPLSQGYCLYCSVLGHHGILGSRHFFTWCLLIHSLQDEMNRNFHNNDWILGELYSKWGGNAFGWFLIWSKSIDWKSTEGLVGMVLYRKGYLRFINWCDDEHLCARLHHNESPVAGMWRCPFSNIFVLVFLIERSWVSWVKILLLATIHVFCFVTIPLNINFADFGNKTPHGTSGMSCINLMRKWCTWGWPT